MDLGITVIGIVIVFICALPIILSVVNNRKKRKKIEQSLFKFATQNNCQISNYGTNNNVTIGVDESNQMLFFIKKLKDKENLQHINLSEVKKCRIVNTTKKVKNVDSNFNVVEKIELGFTFIDHKKEETLLNFYSHSNDGTMFTGDLRFLEKWCKLINENFLANFDKT